MNKQRIILLAVVLAATFSGILFSRLWEPTPTTEVTPRNSTNESNTSNANTSTQANTNTAPAPFAPVTEIKTPDTVKGLTVAGTILYVKGGDVWAASADGTNAHNIVDRDTVVQARYSPSKKYLAYSQFVASSETVPTEDGGEEVVELKSDHEMRQELLLADAVGANSQRISDNVERWGWVPNTSDLLWYESAELNQVFWWGYFGDNRIWMYDLTTKKATKILDENRADIAWSWEILLPTWSPDGTKLAYYGYRRDDDGQYLGVWLRVVQRSTGAIKDLLPIPWVGGDRGGPAPVPSIIWSSDSQDILTTFTPIVGDAVRPELVAQYEGLYTSGYHAALRIPADGSTVTRLIADAPAPGINNESTIKFTLDADQTHGAFISYAHMSPLVFPPAEPFSWYGESYEETPAALSYYDFNTDTVTILSKEAIENVVRTDHEKNTLSALSSDFFWLLRGVKTDSREYVELLKYPLQEKAQPIRVARLLAAREDGSNFLVRNIGWFNDQDAVYFSVAGKLYLVQDDNLVHLAEGVTSADYYIE